MMAPHRALASVLAASLALAAPEARAADPPLDEIFLKDGTFVRGTIVEYLPARSVAIRSAADGQVLRYPWAEVATTTVASRAPAPAPEPFGEDDAPLLHVAVTRPARVRLHEVLTPEPTTRWTGLEWGRLVERARYRIRCAAPCDLVIDGRHDRRFFFAGDEVPRSRTFSLDGLGPTVHARVRPGSTQRFTGGLISVPFGIAAVATGIVFAAPDSDDTLFAPGVVLMSLGTALVVGGIALLVTGRTRVRITGAPRGLAGFAGVARPRQTMMQMMQMPQMPQTPATLR